MYRANDGIHWDTKLRPTCAITQSSTITESHMSTNTELLQGACHCGRVRFEVRTALAPASRCNCSLCRRKGAPMPPPFAAAELKILSGEDALTLYQFNTR